MKAFKLFLASIIVLVSLFTVSPVKATPTYGNTSSNSQGNSDSQGGNGNGQGNQGNGNGNGGPANLPINTNIIFLMAAGMAIGIKVITDHTKKLKPQKA